MEAEPVAADNAVAVKIEPPNPIHNELVTCGLRMPRTVMFS
jgi:hypothetical protein